MLNLHCTAHWIYQVLRLCVQLTLLLVQLSSQTGQVSERGSALVALQSPSVGCNTQTCQGCGNICKKHVCMSYQDCSANIKVSREIHTTRPGGAQRGEPDKTVQPMRAPKQLAKCMS